MFSHPYSYFSSKNGSLFLTIYVKPRSPNNNIKVENDQLIVFIKKPPDKGKANKEVISFLSKELGCSSSDIEIVSGVKSQNKTIKIKNVTDEEIIKLIEKYKK